MRPLDETTLRILFRGRLASCNYDCSYCPFAKRHDSPETLRQDAAELERFVDWVAGSVEPVAILLTPWGEGLVRRHYVDALVRLSHVPLVRRVAIQTNLSSNLRWVERADRTALALWCTYHPGQVSRRAFLERLQVLRSAGVRFSVGLVGLREHFGEIGAIREALHPGEYLWINALDPRPAGYYSTEEQAYLASIDPHFPFNAAPPPSLGAPCRAGGLSISVDGNGDVRPCHFVRVRLGNLYDGTFQRRRSALSCPNLRCDCYIGYIQRTDLAALEPFAQGALERFLRPGTSCQDDSVAVLSGLTPSSLGH
jgi:MoaA/NifB/PqqE/SkfB family radical SAM enzyme